MSGEFKKLRCGDVAPLLVFYTCEELTSEEREQVVAHLADCAECRAQLAEEDSLQQAIEGMPQAADKLGASDLLLSQCRSELAESLDELAAPKQEETRWQFFTWARQWMALRPGWSAAALMLAGAIVGTQAIQWLPFNTTGNAGAPVNVLAASKLSDDLNKVEVSDVNFSRSTGKIELKLQAEQPLTLSSDEDPADTHRVLTFIVSNGDRFDAGMRLECVDALRAAVASDAQARAAVLAAARKDRNPAVRLKALDALRDLTGAPAVREVLLDTVQRDPNPGVRVEAVNLLVHALEMEDELTEAMPLPANAELPEPALAPLAPTQSREAEQRILHALEELRQHDSNRYVRLRSAAALRQIALQDVQ